MIKRGDILSCLDPVRTHTMYSLGLRSVQMASVLLIIHYNYSRPHILLTKRSSALKSHSDEICFPGGKFAKDDKSLYYTAIRETKEEVGLNFTDKNEVVWGATARILKQLHDRLYI